MVDFFYDDVPEDADEWMLAMVRQFELTEKASLAQHEAFQQKTLQSLVEHAIATVPAYKTRLKPLLRVDGSVDLNRWQDVPIMDRREAMALGDDLVSHKIPDDHLPINQASTSGSTGEPYSFKNTRFNRMMWLCTTARFHRWHGFEYDKSLVSFRPLYAGTTIGLRPDTQEAWGMRALRKGIPGTYHLLDMNISVEEQVALLREIKPDYLHSFPTTLRAIALTVKNDGGDPLNLSGILSYGEMLSPDSRVVIIDGLGINPTDCYSSIECGYLALQSSNSDQYLIQSEVNYVEILNEENLPCEPGEAGRVVVTPLHNYAQPLIRYAIGDYAVVGQDDASGLPFKVLSEIYGRTRNLFKFPDGRLVHPDFKTATFQKYLDPKQWQVAQIGPLELEVRIIPDGDPSLMDTEGMSVYIHRLLGDDLTISYKVVQQLTNPRTGKHEDYVCELND